MRANISTVFWCPDCKMKFSDVKKNGVAVCPVCGYKREDGFNLLEDGILQCIDCGVKFLNPHSIEQIKCINGCRSKFKI